MVNISYVYPNVNQMTRNGVRSGLLRRWTSAKRLKCEYIEVPADFAKTSQPLGKEAIVHLYERNRNSLPEDLKYILHTEPSIARRRTRAAPLKWYDTKWLDQFANMVIFLSEFLGKPASMIEIHPGNRRQNSFQDIAESIKFLLDKYHEAFGVVPLILLENRTHQRISRARDIRDFWNFISETHSDLKEKLGIVLDIQQLYTQERKDLERKLKTIELEILNPRFVRAFNLIPSEAIRGFHIHHLHRAPHKTNDIPWVQVFDKIKRLKNSVIINPEVLNEKWVEPTITFCEGLLST